MLKKIKRAWHWLRATYQSSAENRLQFLLFIGFMLVPLLGMSVLFVYEFFFVLR